MGGLMVHERNAEIAALFKESEEAVFFGADDELIERCKVLLNDDVLRRRIADAGHRSVLARGFRHEDRLGAILDQAMVSGR